MRKAFLLLNLQEEKKQMKGNEGNETKCLLLVTCGSYGRNQAS